MGPTPNKSFADQERELVSEMRYGFADMGKNLIEGKLAQHTLFGKSVAEGGPATPQQAISNLMVSLKVGIRRLSEVTGVKRKELAGMIEGRLPLPPEVFVAIRKEFVRVNPTLFEENEPVKDEKISAFHNTFDPKSLIAELSN